jgi:hypothetical protein
MDSRLDTRPARGGGLAARRRSGGAPRPGALLRRVAVRAFVVLLSIALVTAACGIFGGRGRLSETEPAYRPARTTTIMGDWVLATSPDSTAFVGARLVELTLTPSTFVLRAHYPMREPLVVTGLVVSDDPIGGGALTLIPQTNSRAGQGDRNIALAPGERIAVIATAAENTMVFAPPHNMALPSSVWHRKEAAEAAGVGMPPPARRDTTRRPP